MNVPEVPRIVNIAEILQKTLEDLSLLHEDNHQARVDKVNQAIHLSKQIMELTTSFVSESGKHLRQVRLNAHAKNIQTLKGK